MKTSIESRPKLTVATLFLGLTVAELATAADLKVPADYPTIQAAVNAAQTNDTIHIAPGVYTGQVEIVSKTLTLIGQPGTILRATTNMTPFARQRKPSNNGNPVFRGHGAGIDFRGRAPGRTLRR